MIRGPIHSVRKDLSYLRIPISFLPLRISRGIIRRRKHTRVKEFIRNKTPITLAGISSIFSRRHRLDIALNATWHKVLRFTRRRYASLKFLFAPRTS
ncbi:hypothetical protein PUN28_005461 [Cardiocondyla obscurior]|uniref:Uncharacterized protein n=1 Tax=Cardiocondyla obscurior TaxID=286306 RepID=A0AAW2GKQ2_9HYME